MEHCSVTHINQLVTLKIQAQGLSETSGQTYCPCRLQNSEGRHIKNKVNDVEKQLDATMKIY